MNKGLWPTTRFADARLRLAIDTYAKLCDQYAIVYESLKSAKDADGTGQLPDRARIRALIVAGHLLVSPKCVFGAVLTPIEPYWVHGRLFLREHLAYFERVLDAAGKSALYECLRLERRLIEFLDLDTPGWED